MQLAPDVAARWNAPDRAEVDEADAVVRQHHEVGGVRIGMEEELLQQLAMRRAHQPAATTGGRCPGFRLGQELVVLAVDGAMSSDIQIPETRSFTRTSSVQYWKNTRGAVMPTPSFSARCLNISV